MSTSKIRGFMLVLVLFPILSAAATEQIQQAPQVAMQTRLKCAFLGVAYGIIGFVLLVEPPMRALDDSVDFDLDADGTPIRIKLVPYNASTITHQLIRALFIWPSGYHLCLESWKNLQQAFSNSETKQV